MDSVWLSDPQEMMYISSFRTLDAVWKNLYKCFEEPENSADSFRDFEIKNLKSYK